MKIKIHHSTFKVLLLGSLFFNTFYASSQKGETAIAFETAKQFKHPLLYKIIRFSKQKNWDSVLVNTDKLNSTEKNITILDYSHYYRGQAFMQKKMYKQALIETNKVSPKFTFYFKTYHNKGVIYFSTNQIEKAQSEFFKIDTLNKFQKEHIDIQSLLHNIGACYLLKGDYAKAEVYIKKALDKIDRKKNILDLIYYNSELANIYYEQYADEKAYQYYRIAYDLAVKYKDNEAKSFTAFNMAVVEENNGNFEKALQYRKEHENWKSLISDQNKIYEVANMEKKQALRRKQREVKLLQTENKLEQTQRNLYLVAALFLLIVLLFGVYFYRQNVKRSKIILAQKQELDLLNTTKDRLFSIVSHDLRSSVYALKNSNNTLLNHLTSERYQEAAALLEQNTNIATSTYNLLDNLLHWAVLQTKGGYFKQESHRLGMLVEQVAYNFQSLLKEKDIHFENLLPKSCKVFVDGESLKIVLRNLMDNSIKFSDPGAQITVLLVEETEQTVQFIWRDTGRGMQEETRQKLLSNSAQLTKKEHEKEIGSGLGMNLCVSMIQKNGGILDIKSEPGIGTDFIVTLQKNGLDGAKN